jgi:curved DNA-binding protein CbpA
MSPAVLQRRCNATASAAETPRRMTGMQAAAAAASTATAIPAAAFFRSATPHEVMGLAPPKAGEITYTTRDIRRAFLTRARQWHPDTNKGANAQAAAGAFGELKLAYEWLKADPNRGGFYPGHPRANSGSSGLGAGFYEAHHNPEEFVRRYYQEEAEKAEYDKWNRMRETGAPPRWRDGSGENRWSGSEAQRERAEAWGATSQGGRGHTAGQGGSARHYETDEAFQEHLRTFRRNYQGHATARPRVGFFGWFRITRVGVSTLLVIWIVYTCYRDLQWHRKMHEQTSYDPEYIAEMDRRRAKMKESMRNGWYPAFDSTRVAQLQQKEYETALKHAQNRAQLQRQIEEERAWGQTRVFVAEPYAPSAAGGSSSDAGRPAGAATQGGGGAQADAVQRPADVAPPLVDGDVKPDARRDAAAMAAALEALTPAQRMEHNYKARRYALHNPEEAAAAAVNAAASKRREQQLSSQHHQTDAASIGFPEPAMSLNPFLTREEEHKLQRDIDDRKWKTGPVGLRYNGRPFTPEGTAALAEERQRKKLRGKLAAAERNGETNVALTEREVKILHQMEAVEDDYE